MDAIGVTDNLSITVVTLLNDTLEEILSIKKERCRRHCRRFDRLDASKALFDRGVSYADGIYTMRADELLDVIAQAGSEYRFFGKFAKNS
ncbi:Fis family transcriptional regulator [uncultured Campylobacter sp.]|uniref:Fis family transcriptional regulator n=1 Tax=uncultured Campylobacter sp. TaxID=218934 RepID=UPI0025DDEF3E|nr:Fis family transcriptional regulator [uncultured Campylobacter sp.]